MTIAARAAFAAAALTIVAAPRLAAQSGTISVTIGGGPHAGKYEMKDSCEISPSSYPSLFIMAFTVGVTDPKIPRTMEFFTASKRGKPDAFVVSVKFQDLHYQIFTIPRDYSPQAPTLSGRGTVTVKATAAGRTATFSGQTKEGVKMEGTITCPGQSS